MYFNRIQSKTTVALNICTSIWAFLTDFVTSKNNAPTEILLAVMNDTFTTHPITISIRVLPGRSDS